MMFIENHTRSEVGQFSTVHMGQFYTVANIKARQSEYYSVLAECDQEGASTKFIEFSLKLILEALNRYRNITSPTVHDSSSRLDYAKDKLSDRWFSRKNYMDVFNDVSTSTASRDLLLGVEENVLKKSGTKNQTSYCYL